MQNDPEYIIVHTAALEGDHYTIDDIDQWHRDRGFTMVGYHYFVHKDGTLEQGRPEDMHGAHCKDGGMNTQSIGICFQGHGGKNPFTDAQKGCLIRLYREIDDRHSIPVSRIHGHRRYHPTKTCPGKEVSMEELRAMLEAGWDKEQPPTPVETAPLETLNHDLSNIPTSL